MTRTLRAVPLRLVSLRLVLLCFVLSACAPSPDAAKDPGESAWTQSETVETVRPVRDLDGESVRHLSLLLAGALPADERERLDAVWRRHAEAMDALWTPLGPRLDAMDAWARRTMPELAASPALLLVPFSNGRLASALRLFPEATSYLLVGSAPPGRLLLPEETESGDVPPGALGRKLTALRDGLASPIALSDPPTDAEPPPRGQSTSGLSASGQSASGLSAGGPLSGVLPRLLAVLAREGRLPLDVEYVEIDAETARIAPLADDRPTARAVRVVFARLDDDLLLEGEALDAALAAAPRQTVFYVASDLSNMALYPDAPLHRLVAAQPQVHVLVPSSDYRPHRADHSTFRELVLRHGDAVVQDDSGLPLRAFTSDEWSVHLFGAYRGGAAAFKRWFQDDLDAAYARGAAEPLPFGVGTRDPASSALILARRLPASS